MVLPVPPQLPDTNSVTQARRDITPVVPVTSVPAIAEEAQKLGSRQALHWTQPVFEQSVPVAARPSLEVLQTLIAQATSGSQSLPSNPVPAAVDGSGYLLGFLLSLVSKGEFKNPVRWPVSNSRRPAEATMDGVRQHVLSWRNDLAESGLFSAGKLPQILSLLLNEQSDEVQAATVALPGLLTHLEDDSPAAQQAARLLMNGSMILEAELPNNIPVVLRRENSWHIASNGRFEKAAQLTVELKLPSLGNVKIIAYQWASEMFIQVKSASPSVLKRQNETARLNERLSGLSENMKISLQIQADDE